VAEDNISIKELYGEFIDESKELIEAVGKDLVELEKDSSNSELINKIFRAFHTLKGNAGFIGLMDMSDLAHRMENVLGKLRDKAFPFFSGINDALFEGLDISRHMLIEFIEGREVDHDLVAIFKRLEALLEGPGSLEAAKAAKDVKNSAKTAAAKKADSNRRHKERRAQERRDIPEAEAAYMRVSTGRLDKLVNLVGELAAGRSRMLQLKGEMRNRAFDDVASFIASISSQLQDEVLSIRMVPIKQLFNKFYRLVRDISKPLGKEVDLKIFGEDTELDKTIIEVLHDPILHMVRNSIGHGIELPEDRKKAGKPAIGTLTLRASHEHNSVVVEIEDDGKGLDPERIKREAIVRGILNEEEAKEIHDDDAVKIIFMSGFSTSEKVDDLSGRGVGMDVVKTNIEKLGGSVDVSFKKGLGTKFTMKMPLTLAIVQLFLLKEGSLNYGIPLNYVDETIMVDITKIESIKGQMMYMLRHHAVPLVFLSDVLDMKMVDRSKLQRYSVLIVNIMRKRVGFIVDGFLGKVETVIKPLGKFIERLPEPVEGVAGASILGTGEIVMVLDVPGVFKLIEDKMDMEIVKE